MQLIPTLALLVVAPLVHSHPGHDAPEGHLHGFAPELAVLAALVAVWAMIRSKG